MHGNDISLVYTSNEAVGLGMDLLPHEAGSFCNVWGWLLRLTYACYFGTRVAHYVNLAGVNGHESANLVGVVLLDVAFLLALAVNYKLSSDGHVLRRVVHTFPQPTSANPKTLFARASSVIAVLVWGVAIFLAVCLHNNTVAKTNSGCTFAVLAHYVNSILVFGTFCFSMTSFAYAVYCLCFELQKYHKKLRNVFQRIPNATVLRMVLHDFEVFRELISSLSTSLRGVVLIWFAAGTLYVLDMGMRWALGDDGPSLASAVVRTVVVVVLLFLASDLAARLRNRTDDLYQFLKVVALSSTDQETHEILNSFREECFPKPLALRLAGTLYLSRSVFYVWGVTAGSVLAGAAAACYFAVR
ncbi:hypothetical protein ISCGN_001030 [Ixodes scapularis]